MSIPLSILLWLPAAAALLGLLVPGAAGRAVRACSARWRTFAWAIWAIADFDRGARGLQYVTDEIWISDLGIHYKLGIDGLNLFLIALAALLFLVGDVLGAPRREWERPGQFFLFLGLAETAVLGALMAQDLALFVLFFDLMLMPFFFLTGIWGPPATRVAAIIKLFIYTLVGSLLMLAAAIATGVLVRRQQRRRPELRVQRPGGQTRWPRARRSGSSSCFARRSWSRCRPSRCTAGCPTATATCRCRCWPSSRRCCRRSPPTASCASCCRCSRTPSAHFQDLMLLLALGSILYGSAMAFTTTEPRLVLGYSSIAQLGFITLGDLRPERRRRAGRDPADGQPRPRRRAAFVIVACLAERAGGCEDIRDMGGIAFRAPVLATLFLIVDAARRWRCPARRTSSASS